MADPTTGAAPRCQWCSALLPAADLATCPTCGATLNSATETGEIKGVTTLDTEAILRARNEVGRPRSRILSFITGEEPVDPPSPEEAESLAPPDDAVRREMLRLQFEAEKADLEAESIANKTDVVIDEGIDLAALGSATPAADAADVQAAQASPAVPAAPAPDESSTSAAPPPPPTA